MSVSVEGEKCPVCHSYMFDDEDIVFCPICGAPHHRECYKSIGHCALEKYHGTDMEYKRPEKSNSDTNVNGAENQNFTAQNENHTENPNNTGNPADNQNPYNNPYNQNNYNNNYNNSNNNNGNPNGNPNIPFENPFFGNNFGNGNNGSNENNGNNGGNFNENYNGNYNNRNFPGGMPYGFTAPFAVDPLGGVDKNAKTEGVTAEELKNVVGVNSQRYIPKFFKLNKKNRFSWNWAAFLFPQCWFFLRKMYGMGSIFFSLITACGVLSISPMMLISGNEYKNYYQLGGAMLEIFQKYHSVVILVSIGAFVSLLTRVFAALFGDYIYKKRSVKTAKTIKEQPIEEQKLLYLKQGGINIFLGVLALFAVNWIEAIIMAMI